MGDKALSTEKAVLVTNNWVAGQEVYRFLRNHGKPVVLAMSRPDSKKNVATLVKAFGTNKVLRELANLVLILVSKLSGADLRSGQPIFACCHMHTR